MRSDNLEKLAAALAQIQKALATLRRLETQAKGDR